MNRLEGDGQDNHLSEQQLVEYVQQQTPAGDLPMVNLHLVECCRCSEWLSLLILFAAENNLLEKEQETLINKFLTSDDYNSIKDSFINCAIKNYKARGYRLLKRIVPRRFSISLNFSLER